MQQEQGKNMMPEVTRYRLEHHAVPSTISEPNEIYLMDVPVASIDELVRHFVNVEKHDSFCHQYYYAKEDREELDKRLKQIMTWAEFSKGLMCYCARDDIYQTEIYLFRNHATRMIFRVIVRPEVLFINCF